MSMSTSEEKIIYLLFVKQVETFSEFYPNLLCFLLDCIVFGNISCFSSSPQQTYVKVLGASLVAQWLRICLPMQGTRV